ncbi:MAG: formylglycine-generating enzyme family protein [Leptolyngbya sp. SIO1E4]|nr:formylglycine-generating enzyme family protein [Leptolyngbya sp. SIO1E4]
MPSTALQAILKERSGRNQCYDEVLAEDVLPLRMMQIPAGIFLMGSPDDEPKRQDSEGPQHEVTVPDFFMAKYPVTQAQWHVVAGWEAVNRDLKADPSYFKGDKRPIESVSWEDAVEFCDRLTAHTQRHYRLPSEAEWEYACRAGTTTPFHFGETITTEVANYRGTDDKSLGWSGSYGDGPKGEYREETTPVDHFGIANAFGLCDMHGNVLEWCADHWHDNYEGAPTDSSAWIEGGNSSYRVWRGGSWVYYPWYCRSAYRYRSSPDFHLNGVGFRVVCSPPRT